MKTQNRDRQRRGKERQGAENRSDTDILATASFKIGSIVKHFHPYKNEILDLVRILNGIGAKRVIISAALCLKRRKCFCGILEWTDDEVNDLLKACRS